MQSVAPDHHDAALDDWHQTVHPAKPFAIGLKPLAPEHFLQIGDDAPRFRAQKLALYQQDFAAICGAEPDTLNAQREATALIIDNLQRFHGHRFAFHQNTIHCRDDGRTIALDPDRPLASAALLVPDDLVLMARDETGWRLVAASLAFPSSWNLAEKFGKPMQVVHGPVPMDTTMHTRIERIFDHLQPTIPVYRANWSLDPTAALRLDSVELARQGAPHRLDRTAFLRTEFQTLHKLGSSGTILFTIGIRTTALADLPRQPGGMEKLAQLRHQFAAMTPAQKRYKGLDENPADLLACWDEILQKEIL
ncbi:MAG: DUF3445 domain-containing protein [Pseudomonadota bacterium]